MRNEKFQNQRISSLDPNHLQVFLAGWKFLTQCFSLQFRGTLLSLWGAKTFPQKNLYREKNTNFCRSDRDRKIIRSPKKASHNKHQLKIVYLNFITQGINEVFHIFGSKRFHGFYVTGKKIQRFGSVTDVRQRLPKFRFLGASSTMSVIVRRFAVILLQVVMFGFDVSKQFSAARIQTSDHGVRHTRCHDCQVGFIRD